VVLFGKTNVPLMLADYQSYNAVYGTRGIVELTTARSVDVATGTCPMVRKIVRVVKASRLRPTSERLLEVRKTVNEYVVALAIPTRPKRRRAKRSVTLIVK
jgi:hypothetical protein